MPAQCPDVQQLRHELNTPLTVVHARAQLLQRWLDRHPALPEQDRQYLAESLTRIVQASGRMGTVIEEWSRPARPSSARPRRRLQSHPG